MATNHADGILRPEPAGRMPGIDFMSRWRFAAALSLVAVLLSLGSLALQGLNLGLDFTGGVVVEVGYSHPVDLTAVRASLEAADVERVQVQSIGGTSDVLIRLPATDIGSGQEVATKVLEVLRSADPSATLRRSETVGPQVGEDLSEQGGIAMMLALIGIFVYVMLRFRWKFALGAIVATLHDAIVTLGVFSLFRWEFDLTVLGSLLAVVGYSVNDTIVVYDRIRDNFRQMRRAPLLPLVNASINQTLARTMVTALTTLLVLLALLFLGGETLWGFSMTLIVGIVVGTYSSIYVASAIAIALKVESEDFIPRERGPVDDLP